MNNQKIAASGKKTIAGYLFLVALLILAILLNRNLFHQVLQELKHLSLYVIALTCVLGLLYRCLDGGFLYILGRSHSKKMTWKDGVGIAFAGSFIRVATLGSGMMAAKVLYLYYDGVPVGNGTGICLVQYIFYKLSILILGICGLVLHPFFLSSLQISPLWLIFGVLICLVVVGFLLLIALNRKITETLYRLALRLSVHHESWSKNIEKAYGQAKLLQEETHHVLKNRKRGIGLFVLSMFMQFVWYIIPCVVISGQVISKEYVFAAIAVTFFLAGAVPMPSGFGSLEVIFIALMKPAGAVIPATTAAIVFRFTSTIVPFLIGIIFVLIYHRQLQRSTQKD